MKTLDIILIQIVSLIWASLPGLAGALYLNFAGFIGIFKGVDVSIIIHNFWVALTLFTFAFWCIYNFSDWYSRRQARLCGKFDALYTPYMPEYPKWKKIIHYGTVGRQSKVYWTES